MFDPNNCVLCGACVDDSNMFGPVCWDPSTQNILFYSTSADAWSILGNAECRVATEVNFEIAKSNLNALLSSQPGKIVGVFYAEGGTVVVWKNNIAQFFGSDPSAGALEEREIDYFEPLD